jgi:hypothetical protein
MSMTFSVNLFGGRWRESGVTNVRRSREIIHPPDHVNKLNR